MDSNLVEWSENVTPEFKNMLSGFYTTSIKRYVLIHLWRK